MTAKTVMMDSLIECNTHQMKMFVYTILLGSNEGQGMKSETLRTNIVIDKELIEAGLKATGLKTRRELVDYALRELLRHKQ